MHKSKLIYLLKSLDKKEFKELENFLNSPYFNKDKNTVQLYKLMQRDYPTFESSMLLKEKMAKRLFGSTSADSLKKLSYTMSNCTKVLEKYILQKEMETQGDDREFLYLKAFKKRKLDKLFFKKAEDFKKEIKKRPFRDSSFHEVLYRLNHAIFIHPSIQKIDTDISGLNEYISSFNSFFLITKLYHYFLINNHKKVIDENMSTFFQKEVLEKIETSPFNSDSVLIIFKYLIEFQSDSFTITTEHYYELKEQIIRNRSKLNETDQYTAVALWVNYAQTLHKQNAIGFDLEVFNVNKFIVENKLLMIDSEINPILFFNVVQMACELDKIAWVENFIREKLPEVKESMRTETEKVSKAYLNLYKGNYDETMLYLRSVYPSNYYFEIVSKALLVRCYYMTESWDLLDNIIHSFTNYVRRHTKMSSYMKEQTLNFLKFSKRLYVNNFKSNKDKEALLIELDEYEIILYRSWFKKILNTI